MEPNDSYGYMSATQANNTLIGWLMYGAQVVGPGWLTSVDSPVSSWGYNGTLPKEMGASRFTSANTVTLVNAVCAAAPAACN